MNKRIAVLTTALVLSAGAMGPRPASAQEAEVRAHLEEILGVSSETPGGEGLLPTTVAEAATVQEEIQRSLIENDLSSLDEIQIHNRNAVHALDPSREPEGPGRGFGLIQALDRIVVHATAVAESGDAPDPVRERAREVADLAGIAAADARELLQGTMIIDGAADTAEVRALVPDMLSASEALVADVGVLEEAGAHLAEAAGQG